MKASLKIATILDIPIKIHISFLVILGLFAWVFSFESLPIIGFTIGYGNIAVSIYLKILLGILLSLLLFLCVLLHELGHSYVTQKSGFNIESITLFIFGGASQMQENPRESNTEIKIALAGPGVSFLLSGFFYIFFVLTSFYYVENVFFNVLFISFGSLAFYNFILGLFNLIPAYPTDGGRLVRASLSKFMDYEKATSIAANIGKAIAVALAVFGILILNIWLVLISVFLFFGATQEEKSVKISLALEDEKAEDIMDEHIKPVSPDMSVKDFLDFIKNDRGFVYPVVKEDSLKGIVSVEDVKNIDKEKLKDLHIKDIMHKDFSEISHAKKAISAFKILNKDKYGRVFVEKNDKVVGVIGRSNIIRALKMSKI